MMQRAYSFAVLIAVIAGLVPGALAAGQKYSDQLLWGDVHLHTNLSWDAYYMGNPTADAEVAYRFAQGLPVIHPYHRAKVRIDRPLDFLAVTDHSEFLGLAYAAVSGNDERMAASRLGTHIRSIFENGGPGAEALVTMIISYQASLLPPPGSDQQETGSKFPPPPPQVSEETMNWLLGNPDLWGEFFNRDVMRSSWEQLINAAERHNNPGKFTALIGWEYSPQSNGGNLHRVVLTPAGGDVARKIRPFSFLDSDDPEDLWHWLDSTSKSTGAQFVAIPHNSNLSKGTMFSTTRLNGEPVDKNYARLRATWETVAEVTQVKGTSETHPLLSPNDEFADFEFFAHELASFKDDIKVPAVTEADFLRSALKNGLRLENELGVNPFKLGMIGSTDSHIAMTTVEESNFLGKFGAGTTPEEAGKPVGDFSGYTNWDFSSSGLAAVWAKDNTREEIFAAFRRREVYGTTGPRIGVRFFGGYRFSQRDTRARDLAKVGYSKGVPMGGDLLPSEKAPGFLIQAVKDAAGANLDRVQVVKGWLDADGETQEKVFNVAWSGERELNERGELAPVGDSVQRATAQYTNDIGAPEFVTVWGDPEFNPDHAAFYYLRVLEIPTPRHSTYDAVALEQDPPTQYPQVIQERAYSSPIWYTPGR